MQCWCSSPTPMLRQTGYQVRLNPVDARSLWVVVGKTIDYRSGHKHTSWGVNWKNAFTGALASYVLRSLVRTDCRNGPGVRGVRRGLTTHRLRHKRERRKSYFEISS